MSKLLRSELKDIVKECLVEILAEGIGNSSKRNIPKKRTQHRQQNKRVNESKDNVIEKKPFKKFSPNTTENRPNFSNPSAEKDDKFKSSKFVKVPKSFENRRQGTLTISQALSDNNEKVRSLAAVRRAREKAKLRNLNNIENQETSESRERKKRDIIIPDFITVNELALRMAEKSSMLIKSLMKLGVMSTINETIDGDTTGMTNTNVEWMQENMTQVQYEPRKSKRKTSTKTKGLDKFTE